MYRVDGGGDTEVVLIGGGAMMCGLQKKLDLSLPQTTLLADREQIMSDICLERGQPV